MKITYLGTAAAEGFPGIFCNCEFCMKARMLGGKNLRTRSQCIIDDTLLVDFPPDSYTHMLQHDIHFPNIHSILITHTHQDHLYLEDPGLRFEVFSHNIDGMLTLYGNDMLSTKYDLLYRKDTTDKHLAKTLDCIALEEYHTLNIEDYQVTPLLANHDKSEKCLIYYIEKNGASLLYGNDTGWFPKPTWDFLSGKVLDLISLDCTMIQFKDGNNHMGIPDVLDVHDELNRIGCIKPTSKVILTHFSHNGQMLHDEIQEYVKRYGFIVAYDGLAVQTD